MNIFNFVDWSLQDIDANKIKPWVIAMQTWLN